jgi:hypothetical protein
MVIIVVSISANFINRLAAPFAFGMGSPLLVWFRSLITLNKKTLLEQLNLMAFFVMLDRFLDVLVVHG